MLREARKARKLLLSDTSDFTKISEASLAAFEAGEKIPSVPQLSRLASLYNVPVTSFFSNEPFDLELNLPDFRKPNPAAAALSPKGLTRLWQVQNRARFVAQIVNALGRDAPTKNSILRYTNKSRPDAAELRSGFDQWLIGVKEKAIKSGESASVFDKQLRIFLETRACATSVNGAPIDDYMGFFDKVDGKHNLIFINSAVKNEKRRLFTLAHEVAHFVFDEEGVSNPFVANNEIERRCNRFAAEFIAPDHEVLGLVSSASFSELKEVGRLVDSISRNTWLSRQAAALRLRDLEVISNKQVSEFFSLKLTSGQEEDQRNEVSTAMGRNVAVGRKLSEVGLFAAYSASLALRKKLVDVVDIERGLGISFAIQKDVLDLAARRFEAGGH